MKFPVSVGILMGILWGAVLWSFKSTIGEASFLLTGNANLIPMQATIIVFVIAFPVLLTYTLWVHVLEEFLIDFVNSFKDWEEYE